MKLFRIKEFYEENDSYVFNESYYIKAENYIDLMGKIIEKEKTESLAAGKDIALNDIYTDKLEIRYICDLN